MQNLFIKFKGPKFWHIMFSLKKNSNLRMKNDQFSLSKIIHKP